MSLKTSTYSSFFALAALCLFSVLLPSCVQTEEEVVGASRTVLVYIAADNNLSGEVEARCEALCQGRTAWQGQGGELLLFADTPSGASLMRVLQDGSRETVADYGEVNSASPDIFSEVLSAAFAAYPSADGYGLVYFSHASGWLPEGALSATTRSIGNDNGSETELDDFASAIPDGQLDFIVFETCLTSGVEVAYALRNKADYMLASAAEMLSPGFVPVYPDAVRYLMDAGLTPVEAIETLGRLYMAHVETKEGAYRSATLAVTDLSRMEALAACYAAVQPEALYTADELDGMQRFDRPGKYGDSPAVARYFDLEEAATLTADEAAYAALQDELQRTVTWKDATERFMVDTGDDYTRYNGFDITRHCGLTVYQPREELTQLNEAYRQTEWYRAVHVDSI